MNRIGWIVAGVLALLVVSGGVTALVLTSGGDPTSVQEVADAAIDAAEDLDVDEGVDLLCDAPSEDERDQLEDLIEEEQCVFTLTQAGYIKRTPASEYTAQIGQATAAMSLAERQQRQISLALNVLQNIGVHLIS